MRLFGLIDARIDRHDRAAWLTPPFDLRYSTGIAGPYRIVAAAPHTITAVQGQAASAGCVVGAVKTS